MTGSVNDMLKQLDDLVWGAPLMILILSGGIYLTLRMKVLQLVRLPLALKWTVRDEENGEGEVTSFGALCTALSATIGTGNIVGVATAIGTGGPGALLWMELAAFFGMATKYAEGLLAVKYRVVGENHHVLGGPFYYIERGMGEKWRWMGKLFAFFGICVGLFGIGTFSQVNGISSAVNSYFDPDMEWMVQLPFLNRTYSWTVVIASLVLTGCVAAVLIGGIKRIVHVAEFVVPFMAVIYLLITVSLLVCNFSRIPEAVSVIVTSAFRPQAITGGAVGSMFVAMQKGVARGIFSNEAGLGSAPIAAAAARTREPVRQGLVSMTGTFIDTILICTMTGLSIVLTGAWRVEGLEGVAVTTCAFERGLPIPGHISAFLLMLCLVFFAFSTIIGWDYYSERCLEYLSGGKSGPLKVYRLLYIAAVFIGPYITVDMVWTMADIFNGLMAFPNMIAIFALRGVVVEETEQFFRRYQKEQVCRTEVSSHET